MNSHIKINETKSVLEPAPTITFFGAIWEPNRIRRLPEITKLMIHLIDYVQTPLYYLEFAGRNHLLTTFNLRNYQEMAKHPYWKECMLTHIAIDEIQLRPPRHPQRICIFSLPFSEFMPVLSMRKDPFAIPSNGPFAVSTAQHKPRSDSHI